MRTLLYYCILVAAAPVASGRPTAQCHRRDALAPLRHEAFCAVPLCRAVGGGAWELGARDLDALIRAGSEDVLQRIWNHGKIRVVPPPHRAPDPQMPRVPYLPGLSLVNNANAGSAHFAMYFAFPAMSLALAMIGRMQSSSPHLGISAVVHRMDAASIARSPWTKDMAPLVYSLVDSPRIIHGYDSLIDVGYPCIHAVLFHEVDMRNRYAGIEPLPRWIAKIAVANRILTHMLKDDGNRVSTKTPPDLDCRILLIERKQTLDGKVASRRFANQQALFQTLHKYGGAVCTITFEQLPLRSQIARMSSATVVVAAHGAGLVNAAFMRPCSILVEIFPPLVWNHGMYQGLAQDVGVIYRRAVGEEPNALIDAEGREPGCNLDQWRRQWRDAEQMMRRCTSSNECSGCSRDQNIQVSLERLALQLEGALQERRQCLLE